MTPASTENLYGARASSNVWLSLRKYLEMVRFSHTIFALPFAILSLIWTLAVPLPTQTSLGGNAVLRWVGILICMVTARNFAMSVNRWADAKFDALNPRTDKRHIPSGKLTSTAVIGFGVGNAIAFVLACLLFWPNPLPILLCLPVLLWIGGYSFAKRFTWAVHLWLGAALMMAPVCTWIALRGELLLKHPLDIAPAMWLGIAVLFWVAGFDMIYACQDEKVDQQLGLYSMASRFGAWGALRIAAACHAIMVAVLLAMPWMCPTLSLGPLWIVTVIGIGVILTYEHRLVSPQDLTRINLAFFYLNAIISVVLCVAGGVDAWL